MTMNGATQPPTNLVDTAGGKRRRRRRTRSRKGKRGGSFLNRLIVPGTLLFARTGLPSKKQQKKTRRRRRTRKN
tara:strand:- start:44 stop:265 length:222 start_codon:yes stop_codon:yes gene_type:complete